MTVPIERTEHVPLSMGSLAAVFVVIFVLLNVMLYDGHPASDHLAGIADQVSSAI
jgi:hypothetical protein